ncbi:excinuclease ABC subunit UvrC [Prochlorococcus marinus]|uniref:excinuclease ABC subunit UvrC n=1 Tax=Prochlorococcus marinus TaxID=1219 RepID=UPI0022B32D6E|nr:excinuclease ABC subunit UvrC [Prochlorococcus marinus]
MCSSSNLQSLKHDLDRLKKIIKLIPLLPGCYLFKDYNDRILYIGKSKSLRNRVKTYFNNQNEISARISLMVRQIFDIEYIITNNEDEALTLESNLIKTNKPYFNILLKDDKKYPFVCITWSEKYPRIFLTRRRRNRNIKDRYFGPFVDVTLLRNTLGLLKKIFPVRQRFTPLYKDKPCLNYSINRCPGVCQELISSEEYKKTIKNIEMIFQGRTEILISELETKMKNFSDDMKYESAIKIRDQLRGLKRLGQTQNITDPDSNINRDVIASSSNDKTICIQLFQIRSGKLIGRLAFTNEINDVDKLLIIQRVMEEHYTEMDSIEIPPEIIIEEKLQQNSLIEDWLSELRKRKVRLIVPKRNKKLKLINLVKKNAHHELIKTTQSIEKAHLELEALTELLDLNTIPHRIEGYDISHIQGSDAVASQVVFIDGIPAKQHYRKYNIKSSFVQIGHSDDYLSIEEVITRRFLRWSNYKKDGIDILNIKANNNSILDPITIKDLPDLVLIDGGKGQLNSAFKALEKLNLENDILLCSLAKKNEEVFIIGSNTSLDTEITDPSIMLLRRIRDEAHRFALTFHQNKRSKNITRSHLTDIEGIGNKRIKTLLAHFTSIEALKIASLKDIEKVPGIGNELAYNIWKYFHN